LTAESLSAKGAIELSNFLIIHNLIKHDVSFEEASTAFKDDLSIPISDPFHSEVEDRYFLLGYSINGRLYVEPMCSPDRHRHSFFLFIAQIDSRIEPHLFREKDFVKSSRA